MKIRDVAMKLFSATEIVTLLVMVTVGPFLYPKVAEAVGGTQIRQEVNIVDSYYFSPSGSYATSSEIAAITDSNYTSPTYYFEVVASTTAATNATVKLVNATSSAAAATITINGTGYARYRSTAFQPNASTSVQYQVVLGNESVGKGILAARIVVLQNATTLSKTETQIEIGNNETFSGTGTTTFAFPKYWYYNSAGWDASPTFTASVTYKVLNAVASSTTYATPGTYTVLLPSGTASTSVGLWGGGGAGGGAASNGVGGDGGAGGQFASSTLAATTSSHTLVVAATKAGAAGVAGGQGATSTWDGAVVVAGGGNGGGLNAATTTGNTVGCVGTICRAGGNGAKGSTTFSGGGGGGAGTGNAGGSSPGGITAGTGGTTGGGNGGTGKTATAAGAAGSNFGGGGSGSFKSSGGTNAGGTGAQGEALITNYIATSTIAIQEDNGAFASWTDKAYLVVASSFSPSVPTLTTSTSFTPTNGRHYRLALGNKDSRTSIAVYNAKIVAAQTTTASNVSIASTALGSDVNLVNYYRLNGNGTDEKAAANGTVTGSPAYSTSYCPISGAQGVFLNNTTGAVSATQYVSAAFYAPGVNSFTYYALVNFQVLSSSGNFEAVIHNETNGATGHPHIYFGYDGSGNFQAQFSDSGGAGFNLTSSGVTVSANRWYQMAVTRSGNNFNLYIDGVSVASNTTAITLIASSNGQIGRRLNTTYANQTPLNGYVCDVAMFNRALTTTELSSILLTPQSPTLLEPQYLLANMEYFPGTGLQNYITSFDPAEWSTTNNYLHAVSAADNSTSVAGLYDTSGTLQINSTVTSPDNFATSTAGICMPSTQTNLDTKATTNNNDLYADEIIVQVGVTSTATGCTSTPLPTNSIVVVKAQMIIREPVIIK
jgi:hypothetical protein